MTWGGRSCLLALLLLLLLLALLLVLVLVLLALQQPTLAIACTALPLLRVLRCHRLAPDLDLPCKVVVQRVVLFVLVGLGVVKGGGAARGGDCAVRRRQGRLRHLARHRSHRGGLVSVELQIVGPRIHFGICGRRLTGAPACPGALCWCGAARGRPRGAPRGHPDGAAVVRQQRVLPAGLALVGVVVEGLAARRVRVRRPPLRQRRRRKLLEGGARRRRAPRQVHAQRRGGAAQVHRDTRWWRRARGGVPLAPARSPARPPERARSSARQGAASTREQAGRQAGRQPHASRVRLRGGREGDACAHSTPTWAPTPAECVRARARASASQRARPPGGLQPPAARLVSDCRCAPAGHASSRLLRSPLHCSCASAAAEGHRRGAASAAGPASKSARQRGAACAAPGRSASGEQRAASSEQRAAPHRRAPARRTTAAFRAAPSPAHPLGREAPARPDAPRTKERKPFGEHDQYWYQSGCQLASLASTGRGWLLFLRPAGCRACAWPSHHVCNDPAGSGRGWHLASTFRRSRWLARVPGCVLAFLPSGVTDAACVPDSHLHQTPTSGLVPPGWPRAPARHAAAPLPLGPLAPRPSQAAARAMTSVDRVGFLDTTTQSFFAESYRKEEQYVPGGPARARRGKRRPARRAAAGRGGERGSWGAAPRARGGGGAGQGTLLACVCLSCGACGASCGAAGGTLCSLARSLARTRTCRRGGVQGGCILRCVRGGALRCVGEGARARGRGEGWRPAGTTDTLPTTERRDSTADGARTHARARARPLLSRCAAAPLPPPRCRPGSLVPRPLARRSQAPAGLSGEAA